MPTYCEPWPGKTKATGRVPYAPIVSSAGLGDGNFPLDVIPGFANRAKLLGILVRNFHPVFLFERHDQLDKVQRIGLQVFGEGGFRGYLLNVDAQLLGDDAPELLEIRFGHPSLLLSNVWAPWWRPNWSI